MKENVLKSKDVLVNTSKELVGRVKTLYSDVIRLFDKPVYPDMHSSYYETPIFDEVFDIVNNVKNIINFNYSKVGDTFYRIIDIPKKFLVFFD